MGVAQIYLKQNGYDPANIDYAKKRRGYTTIEPTMTDNSGRPLSKTGEITRW